MREHFLEDRLVRIEAEIAALSEIAQARTIASVDMRPRIDRLEDQMRDVVKMVHHLAEMVSENARTIAPAPAPAAAEPGLGDLNAQIEDLRDCVGTLVQLVTQIASARAAA